LFLNIIFFTKYFVIYLFNLLFYDNSVNNIFICSVPLIKSRRLTKKQKESFSINSELKAILVGLLLGDLFGRLRFGKVSFVFKQGLVHKDYLMHLYNLFSHYSPSSPKINKGLPDNRTGKIYTNIYFYTYTLPCFNELYNLFYYSRKKIVPKNIEELLTPISLAY
jgi:hypothetical protein